MIKILLILQNLNRPFLILPSDMNLLSSWTVFKNLFRPGTNPQGGKGYHSDTFTDPSAFGQLSLKPAFKLLLSWFPLPNQNFHAQWDSQLCSYIFLVFLLGFSDSVPNYVLFFLAPG